VSVPSPSTTFAAFTIGVKTPSAASFPIWILQAAGRDLRNAGMAAGAKAAALPAAASISAVERFIVF